MIVRRERPPPRRATGPVRCHQRHAASGLRHRHHHRFTAAHRGAPPRAGPGRGPRPLRQVSTSAASPHGLHHQRRLARTRLGRHRPARLDPDAAPGRGIGPRGAEEAALPTPARRRPDHPRCQTNPATPHRQLALGSRPRRRVSPGWPPCLDPPPGPAPDRPALDHQRDTTGTGRSGRHAHAQTATFTDRTNPTDQDHIVSDSLSGCCR